MKRALLALTLAASTAACAKVTYENPGTTPGMTQSTTGHFLIFGLVGNKTIPVYQMCPSGFHRIQSKFSFVNLLLAALTFNIYTPRSYEITCNAGAPPAPAPAAAPAGGAQ